MGGEILIIDLGDTSGWKWVPFSIPQALIAWHWHWHTFQRIFQGKALPPMCRRQIPPRFLSGTLKTSPDHFPHQHQGFPFGCCHFPCWTFAGGFTRRIGPHDQVRISRTVVFLSCSPSCVSHPKCRTGLSKSPNPHIFASSGSGLSLPLEDEAITSSLAGRKCLPIASTPSAIVIT